MSEEIANGHRPRPTHVTLGEIATRVTPIAGTLRCADVERLLIQQHSPSSLVARDGHGRPFLVERLAFLNIMAGPVGFGRMLHHDRPVQDVVRRDCVVLPASTTVTRAFDRLLAHPARDRFRDLVVEYPDGTYGLLEAAKVLELVAEINANAAVHDPLTGLGNRTMLLDAVESALHAGRGWLAVLFVDLDRFKVVNDGLGHDAGDVLLTAIADRIRRTVRERGLATRLGGDEFAVVLEGDTEAEVTTLAEALAQELIDAVRGPVRLGDRRVVTTASIGIAIAAPEADPQGLLRHADIAMYQAKRAGGRQYRVIRTEQDRAAQERLDLEIWLRHAFARGGLHVLYQPIVGLGDGSLAGFEALIRGVHPDRGLLDPGVFLPVAAEIGLMPEIDAWVLEQGLRQWRAWRDRGGGHLRLSVNLSAATLGRPQSLDRFKVLLDRAGVPPDRLLLEVTEGEALSDTYTTESLLHGLRALGAQIAIDDFGTGYSSLAQLARLPIDVLKIDRTFVQQIGAGGRSEEMTRIIVSLARGMRATTVAEGIESEAQAAALRRAGCEAGQGYYFAAPLAASHTLDLIDRAGRGLPAVGTQGAA